ncbi:diguanylate cyclase regulator RdcB family protein [Paenibacillus tianjinensis]|uniref:YjcZ-like protein n=1 Tax=Paenibacillus tianjinensis TaxID=2810347 RepID=A0ABX7LHC0_9BACL|nr:diguanylate cyclase regulator RdcB family protein [Paenibacillus tianjinensis]QSF46384.1 hypothetical protein JRJ22_07295 [Paenibacillus tianjinensis]
MNMEKAEEERQFRKLIESVPVLHDKLIVDLVNGIEVTKDHINFREVRNPNFFSRAWDGLTGKSANRQQQIDLNLSRGLQAASVWLQNVQAEQIRSDRALVYVSKKLAETRIGIQKLVASHLDLRDDVQKLGEKIGQFEELCQLQMSELKRQIQSIGQRQSAVIQMNKEFDKWESGGYSAYAPLSQLLIVLETLNWGAFGEYDTFNTEFRDQLFDKCVIMLKNHPSGSPCKLYPTEEWLLQLVREPQETKEIIGYLLFSEGPWCDELSLNSTILDMLNIDSSSSSINKQVLSGIQIHDLPYVLDSRRLSKRLFTESRLRLESEGLYVSSL